jgi:hypothetical protein
MNILNNFTNPWESNGAFGSKALGTEVLSNNVLSQVSLPVFENKDQRGFRRGKDLVDEVYQRINKELAKLNEVLKELAKELSEANRDIMLLSDNEADLLKKEELNKTIESLRSQIVIEKEKAKSSEFYKTKVELDTMNQSDVYFDILPAQSYLGEAKFDGYAADGTIVIGLYYPAQDILDKIPLVAHELKHGYQFLKGQLAFDKNEGTASFIYDITDEIEAFQREALFASKEGNEDGILQKKNSLGRYIRFSAKEPAKAFEIASLSDGYDKVYEVFGEQKISLTTKFRDIPEKGQDFIFYGKGFTKITALDEEYDALYRNSDYEIIQYLVKIKNIVYYYEKR